MKLMSRRPATQAPAGGAIFSADGHVIGLDIGATAVRAAVLTPPTAGGQTMGLTNLGQEPLPPGTVTEGVVTNAAVLTRVLSQMWKENDFGCRQVIIGVASPQVVVRGMDMPRLARDQQARALPFLAKEIIALPVDQALLDFQQIGPAGADGDAVSGLLIAAPRQPVLIAVKAVEAAGLRIVRVDLASFAALRAGATSGVPTEAVIDIGAQMTTIVIHHLGVPRVVRTLGRGGQHLTERLIERTGASQLEAEALKREMGLLGGDSEASMILRNSVRPLLNDIRGSLQYFATANESMTIEQVSLTGGGSGLPGLAEMLTEDTGIACTVTAPLQHVRDVMKPPKGGDGNRLSAATAVSIGLAMGAAA